MSSSLIARFRFTPRKPAPQAGFRLSGSDLVAPFEAAENRSTVHSTGARTGARFCIPHNKTYSRPWRSVPPPRSFAPSLRVQLEDLADALAIAAGETELRLRFSDGRLRWFETSTVRWPPSKLEPDLAGASAPSGTAS